MATVIHPPRFYQAHFSKVRDTTDIFLSVRGPHSPLIWSVMSDPYMSVLPMVKQVPELYALIVRYCKQCKTYSMCYELLNLQICGVKLGVGVVVVFVPKSRISLLTSIRLFGSSLLPFPVNLRLLSFFLRILGSTARLIESLIGTPEKDCEW